MGKKAIVGLIVIVALVAFYFGFLIGEGTSRIANILKTLQFPTQTPRIF